MDISNWYIYFTDYMVTQPFLLFLNSERTVLFEHRIQDVLFFEILQSRPASATLDSPRMPKELCLGLPRQALILHAFNT